MKLREAKIMTNDETREPTNRDIMNRIEEAEGQSRVMMWISLMAVASTLIIASLAPEGWWAVVLGGVMLIIGGLGVGYRWSPW
jgi:fatty acid desaturase